MQCLQYITHNDLAIYRYLFISIILQVYVILDISFFDVVKVRGLTSRWYICAVQGLCIFSQLSGGIDILRLL